MLKLCFMFVFSSLFLLNITLHKDSRSQYYFILLVFQRWFKCLLQVKSTMAIEFDWSFVLIEKAYSVAVIGNIAKFGVQQSVFSGIPRTIGTRRETDTPVMELLSAPSKLTHVLCLSPCPARILSELCFVYVFFHLTCQPSSASHVASSVACLVAFHV